MKDSSGLYISATKHIRSSRKHVTILFSDIEESTTYWDKYGDIEGRLMVDRHNRLMFPIIQKFRGRIIKTIGDSIMASFMVAGFAARPVSAEAGCERTRSSRQ